MGAGLTIEKVINWKDWQVITLIALLPISGLTSVYQR